VDVVTAKGLRPVAEALPLSERIGNVILTTLWCGLRGCGEDVEIVWIAELRLTICFAAMADVEDVDRCLALVAEYDSPRTTRQTERRRIKAL